MASCSARSVRFWPLFKEAVGNFFGNFVSLFGVVLFFALVFAGGFFMKHYGIMVLSQTGFSLPPIVLVLIELLSIFVAIFGIVYSFSLIYAGHLALKKKRIGLVEVLWYVIRRLWAAIILSLRVFWYVMKWPLLIAVVAGFVYVIMVVVVGAENIGGLGSLGAAVGAQDWAGVVAFFGNGVNLFILALVLIPLLGLLYFGILRGVRSLFSFYVFVAKNVNGKKALEESISMVGGKFWKVFGLYVAVSVVLGLIVSFPMALVFRYLGQPGTLFGATAQMFVQQLVAGMVGMIVVLYLTDLYLKLKK